MGRLSAYAKNRILKLRFKKNKRIIHIVEILKKDDNIKVSRQAVSTFLKKYLETNSIYDKPRTGRKRKLTQEEIQLIGQVTRLNRDITARAIKEYLNLNVSTYTILRATKLFEWNKINPNSNDSKKAAALERQLNVSSSSLETSKTYAKKGKYKKADKGDGELNDLSTSELNSTHVVSFDDSINDELDKSDDFDKNASFQSETETVDFKKLNDMKMSKLNQTIHELESSLQGTKIDLQLIPHRELLSLKNLSCSPMSFATKILFKIFKIEELHGHNVSGKTLNKNLKAKLPLDPIRIGYIKYLVESYYDEKECKEMLSGVTSHKQDLWKSCHTAINKSILISERKAAAAIANGTAQPVEPNTIVSESTNEQTYYNMLNTQTEQSQHYGEEPNDSDSSDIELQPKLIKHKKTKNTVIMTRRQLAVRKESNTRNKSHDSKMVDEDDTVESDEENLYQMADVQIKDEADIESEVNFEIELIQNIENRQVNKTATQPLTTNMKYAKTTRSSTNPPQAKQPLNNISQAIVPKKQPSIQQAQSSEASAAANIAAAMKKRIVVIASSKQSSPSATSPQ